MSNCSKCGAVHKKRPVKYVEGTAPVLNQTATVQFRKRVSTNTASGVTSFFPSQIVKIDFSTAYILLSDDCEALIFMKKTEKIEFNLTYLQLEC